MQKASFWINHLQLRPHPEGGFFSETYRSAERVQPQGLPPRFTAARSFSTSIYFLLKQSAFSALHRLKADELWHFYTGHRLLIDMLLPDGSLRRHVLGPDPGRGEAFQAVVPAGCWFGSRVESHEPEAYALVGCTVAPGFDFADFELANRADLIAQYPQREAFIRSLTREP